MATFDPLEYTKKFSTSSQQTGVIDNPFLKPKSESNPFLGSALKSGETAQALQQSRTPITSEQVKGIPGRAQKDAETLLGVGKKLFIDVPAQSTGALMTEVQKVVPEESIAGKFLSDVQKNIKTITGKEKTIKEYGDEFKSMADSLPKNSIAKNFIQSLDSNAAGLTLSIMDVIFGGDIAKAGIDGTISVARKAASSLPEELLYKIETSNIPARDIITTLTTGEVSPEATKFVQSLSNEERKNIFSVARNAETIQTKVVTGKTKLGEFAGVPDKTMSETTPIKGRLPGMATMGEPQPKFGMQIQPVEPVGYGGELEKPIVSGAKDIEEIPFTKAQEQMAKEGELGAKRDIAREGTATVENKFEQDQKLVRKANEPQKQTKKPSFWQELKVSLSPFKYADPITRDAWSKRVKLNYVANELANREFMKLESIPAKDSFQTVLDYQEGKASPYREKIREVFDAMYSEANERGIEVGYLENYIPQIYSNTADEVIGAVAEYMKDSGVEDELIKQYFEGKVLPEEVSKTLKLNPSFARERAFPDYRTAIKYGLTPKYSHPAQYAAHYRNELEKTLANREFITTLKEEGVIMGAKLPGYKPVDLPFSNEELFAKPRDAKALNEYFRDEEHLGVGARIAKFGATVSRRMQELVLSGGMPSTNINFFTIGQAIKDLTAAETKVLGNFARSNFDSATMGWFRAHQPYIEKMADEGISLSSRVGNWNKAYQVISSKKGLGKFIEKTGQKFDDLFNKKTFQSFMPMQTVSVFKQTYDKALEKGMDVLTARKLAGDTTKAWAGIIEDWGRGKTTQDVINSLLFAPRFRESLVNLLGNTLKSFTTEFGNPSFAKNRKFLIGAVITFIGYNLLNKQLNGNYMWENESGKEFDLKIPIGNGQYTYLAFLPSVLSFPRNMASGLIATYKGDISLAGQKFGSLLSMSIKLLSEIASNKDYFGREIYDPAGTRMEKLSTIAKYIGIDNYNHPYVQGAYNLIAGNKNWYEVSSKMLELPFKFNSQTNIEKGQYYDALDARKQERAKEMNRVRDTYDKLQQMKAEGKTDEANLEYYKLSDEDRKLYDDIKTSEKTKKTNSLKAKMYPVYQQLQELKSQGKNDYANEIYNQLSQEEKHAYQLIKNTFQ